jgi:hypothetical protein
MKKDSAPAAPPDPKTPPPNEDLPTPPLHGQEWALYGRLYDLRTLLPLPNATVTVQFEADRVPQWWVEAKSDAYGRYVAKLDRSQEGLYTVAANQSGYEPSVLCEPDVPYAGLKAEEREDLVTGVQSGDVLPSSFNAPADGSSMRRDLFLSPRRAAAPTP